MQQGADVEDLEDNEQLQVDLQYFELASTFEIRVDTRGFTRPGTYDYSLFAGLKEYPDVEAEEVKFTVIVEEQKIQLVV